MTIITCNTVTKGKKSKRQTLGPGNTTQKLKIEQPVILKTFSESEYSGNWFVCVCGGLWCLTPLSTIFQ